MSLTVLIRGHCNSIPVLSDTCFTKTNYNTPASHPNNTLSANTPLGVLGGSIAGVSASADYTVVPCTTSTEPLGLFMNDAAGAAFENSPAVASGKLAIMHGQASVEVDVYETHNSSDAEFTSGTAYATGNRLFSSVSGFLTKEVISGGTIVGVVTKAPTTASPTLGLTMRI